MTFFQPNCTLFLLLLTLSNNAQLFSGNCSRGEGSDSGFFFILLMATTLPHLYVCVSQVTARETERERARERTNNRKRIK